MPMSQQEDKEKNMELNDDFEKVKFKIKKLLAIADDPKASDNEVYTAIKKAHKLMAEYNISKAEIEGYKQTITDVCKFEFDMLLPMIYGIIIGIVAENFRCICTYRQYRQQAYYSITGLNEDVEIAKQVLLKIFVYLKVRLKSYVKSHKKQTAEMSYILGIPQVDARIVKKSYCYGFANGMNDKFEENRIELQEEFSTSTALAVVGVPDVVHEYVDAKVKPKIVKRKKQDLDHKALNDGYRDGKKFNV